MSEIISNTGTKEFEFAKLPPYLAKIALAEQARDEVRGTLFRSASEVKSLRATGSLRPWILTELSKQGYSWPVAPAGVHEVLYDDERYGAMGRRALFYKGNKDDFPSEPVMVGGMCCLYTGDAEEIRKGKIKFSEEDDLGAWMFDWYPRMDQLDGTIGIPPQNCKRAVYIVEDSTWAAKIIPWIKEHSKVEFDLSTVASIFRRVHDVLGKPAIENWLRMHGYEGSIELIYTSDVESEYQQLIKRVGDKRGKTISRDSEGSTRVALLYDAAWLKIVGVDPKQAVIMEPANHIYYEEGLLDGSEGMHKVGYLPFWNNDGPTRHLPYKSVPNRGNCDRYQTKERWDLVNFLFGDKNSSIDMGLEDANLKIYDMLQRVYGLPNFHQTKAQSPRFYRRRDSLALP